MTHPKRVSIQTEEETKERTEKNKMVILHLKDLGVDGEK